MKRERRTPWGKDIFDKMILGNITLRNIVSLFENMDALRCFLDDEESADVSLPYVVLADKDGNILVKSIGYRIGIGEQLLKYVN